MLQVRSVPPAHVSPQCWIHHERSEGDVVALSFTDEQGMMTFDSADLSAALDICKGTATLSQSLRRPVGSLASRLTGLVKSTSVATIRSMTVLERHAELVYAETSLMKAVLAIVSGGDWMGLIKEAYGQSREALTY